ncbi:MAG: TetR/AcrR family transcriptional regulator [Phycisphaerae bacterium]
MARTGATRERLINTAADLFYVGGFQAVGLDQILVAVGITKTAFYKHFDSKDDLIIAVLDHRDRADIAEAVRYMRAAGGRDPQRQILALFDQLGEWFQSPGFRGCLFMNAATEFASPKDPIHRAAAAHSEHIAAELLLRVQAAGVADPELVTKQLMLLFAGAIAARHAGGAADAACTARRAAEALLGASEAPLRADAAARGRGAAADRPAWRPRVAKKKHSA